MRIMNAIGELNDLRRHYDITTSRIKRCLDMADGDVITDSDVVNEKELFTKVIGRDYKIIKITTETESERRFEYICEMA